MKLAFLIVVAAVIAVLAGELRQTNWQANSGIQSIPSTASTNPLVGVRPWNPGSVPIQFTWSHGLTNLAVAGLQTDIKLPAYAAKPSPPESLPPRVYRTSPYTILVLVPGRQPDDNSILKPGTAGPKRMPIVTPGLEFLPYSFAEK